MQKKIIAMAVAGLVSGGAFAQSNVTVSGAMKLYVDNLSASGCTGGAVAASSCANPVSRGRVTNGTSFVRFAGEESLGNGMKASFQIEQDINGDTVGAGFGNRNTGVMLGGNFGTVTLGNWDMHYTSHATIDLTGLDDQPLTSNSLNLLNWLPINAKSGTTAGLAAGTYAGAQTLVMQGGRFNNTVKYNSPVMSGFQAQLGYSFMGESTAPGLSAKDNAWQLMLNYDNGPINAMWSHVRENNAGVGIGTTTTGYTAIGGNTYTYTAGALTAATYPTAAVATLLTNALAGATVLSAAAATSGQGSAAAAAFGNRGFKQTGDRLGFAWTFPMGLKVGMIWDRGDMSDEATGQRVARRTVWVLPVSYTTGAHRFNGTYAKAGNSDGVTLDTTTSTMSSNSESNTGARMWSFGYSYAMSKRTNLNVSWTELRNDSAANYDFWSRGGSASAIPRGVDQRLISAGMRHTF